jgi:predicted GNAT family acetyltransferase
VSCLSVQDALYAYLAPEERSVRTENELFDEYASLAVMNRHYAVTLASNDPVAFSDTQRVLYAQSAVGSIRKIHSRIKCMETRVSSIHVKSSLVRLATDADTECAAALFSSCFKDLATKYHAVKKFVQLACKDIRKGVATAAWVVDVEGELVCYGGLQVRDSVGEVKHLCCEPSYRRRGLASAVVWYLPHRSRHSPFNTHVVC